MDPRLSPNLTPQPQKPASPANPAPVAQSPHPPTQPVPAQPIPPAPVASTPTNSIEQPMVPQVVAAFPVKQPDAIAPQVGARATSIPPNPSQADNDPSRPSEDLDKLLRDVNDRVKAPEKPSTPKKKLFGKKPAAKIDEAKVKPSRHKPFGPVAVVVMVALMLSATAIFAYHEGSQTATAAKGAGKVGTSYAASSAIQEAGGTLVNPSDLDDYAQTLQTKLNSLNDSQDFTSNSLSDKVLGL